MWIIMKQDKEFYGILQGFDEYLNLVMHDCKEYEFKGKGCNRVLVGHMDILLLNGAHICMMVPGDNPKLTKAANESD